MAQIPYGYRIEKGSIVIDTEAAAKISRFAESYLSGLSVKESKKAAEIPLSETTLNHLLKNSIYLGTDIYPPLTTAEVFNSVQKERERRTHPATTRPSDPVPVKNRFTFIPEAAEPGVITGAADTTEQLYSMIRLSSDGKETASSAEIHEMRSTAGKMMQCSADQMMQRSANQMMQRSVDQMMQCFADQMTQDAQEERRPTWQ